VSGLILPNRFTSQPPVGTLVDQAKAKELGVVYLAVANESGMLRDVIGGKDIVNPGGSSTGHTGRVWTFSGAQQSNKAITLTGEASLFVCARIKATAAQAGVPGAAFGVYNSGAQSGFGVGFSGSNQVGLAWITNAGAGIDAYSTGALNAWYDVYTNLEVASVGKRAWINGRPATTNQGSSVSNWITGQNEIAVGAQHRSSGFLRNFTGHIEWAAVLILDNAKIDDALSARLYADRFPYNLFKSPQRRIWVVGAGGGISLSLTGQSLTANLGALSASVTSSVTGNQTTLQQGTITANVSQTLTGQAISLVQGSVSSDVSTVITGQTVSLAQGSVTDASSGNVTKALSGQSLSVSQGALTASISLALNGQSIVLSGGSVSPAISSALAGQQASVQQGNVSANISAGLTGQAAVISNGTVFQAGSDVTKALTGQQLSIALGVLLEKKTIARPSSDTTAGAWLPSAGSSLYATLDEVSPDDADYIYTNSVSTCKIALNAVADPLTSSGQIVSYRVWSPNSNGLTVRLMQGATEIASWTHTVLPTSPTTYQQTLTAGQCDAITDYSTLAIQLESV